VTAGKSPIGRKADTGPGRRALVPRGFSAPSTTTLLTVVGIGLGASLIFASLAVGRGVERSIERTVEVSLGRSDFRVSALDGGILSEEMLVTIRSVLGVEVAAPAVEQLATLLPADDTTAPSGSPVTIHGIDPILDGQIRDLDLVAGTTITRRDEAAAIITERLAADDGYGLGSDVIVATPGEPERFRVIGIAAGDGPLAESGGRTVILPIDAVARMFGLDGVARVDLLVGEGVPLSGVQAELGEALAGEPYVLTSPADLAESLRLPMTGFAVTATGIAAVGTLVGALLVFSAVRLTREAGEVRLHSRVRVAAVRGAIGSGLGGVLAMILGALTSSDVAPGALGLGGIAAAVAVTVPFAVAGGVLPPTGVSPAPARMLVALATGLGRFVEAAMPRSLRAETRIARTALERDQAGTARTVAVLAIAIGLVVAVAMVGANAHRTATEQAPAPVLVRVVAQIDALGLFAVVVAGLAIVGTVAMGNRERLAQTRVLEDGILGLAGAVLGSITGLGVGAVLIVLGGGRIDPAADVPWATLGLSIVLGIGLSMAAAWYRARLARRRPIVRAVRFG
jgi:hypothetical protein